MKLYFTILFFVLSGISANHCYAQTNPQQVHYSDFSYHQTKKNILILNSYHQNYHWADDIMSGVFSELKDKHAYELYVEYMDTKRCSDSLYYTQLRDVYLHKYKNVDIDVILACDDNALNFMLLYRNQIFPNVPVSFCGVVDYQSSRTANHKLYSGVYETFDIAANLKLIQKLHPEVYHIVFISDVTESGKALTARMKRAEAKLNSKLNIDYLISEKPEQIKSYLHQLNDNSAIIWAIYMRLPNGQFISSEESIDFISSNTSRPLYCIWDVVGQGVVGGRITTPFYQGAEAAKIAKRILNGEPADSIKVSGSPILYKFDYNILQAFNIPLAKLPDNSVIINKPTSFWQANKKLAITIVIIIVSLLFVVLALIYLYRKSKKVELQITRKNKKLRKIRNKLLRTNEQLKISKIKAEESNKLKTAFLANLSHEIRTPMNGIVGFTAILQEGDLENEEHKLYLDLIDNSSQRMVRLIDDLVNISRIESGTIELHYSEIKLTDFFKEMFLFFEKEAHDKNLILELKQDPKISTFLTDKSKLEQIFYNLIKNALKYTEQGYVHFGYSKRNEHIDFFVEDSGIGISERDQMKIFERFHQIDFEDSTKGGIGLGLSIVKEFVEILGGSIQLDSKINKGSRFYFSIPIYQNLNSKKR